MVVDSFFRCETSSSARLMRRPDGLSLGLAAEVVVFSNHNKPCKMRASCTGPQAYDGRCCCVSNLHVAATVG